MMLPAGLLLLLLIAPPSWGGEAEPFPDLNPNHPAALREATRVLEEELKLAAKPQTYVLLDLEASTIRIKGRGVDLYTMAIPTWSVTSARPLTGIFRLTARPAVVRRKIDPTATEAQEPISLTDMPADYTLTFQPPLRIDIHSLKDEGPWEHSLDAASRIWNRVRAWGTRLFTGDASPTQNGPGLTLSLSVEHAQSLAWSTVDGMPLIIRQSTKP